MAVGSQIAIAKLTYWRKKFGGLVHDRTCPCGYDIHVVVLLPKSVPVSRKKIDNSEYEDPADAVPKEIAATHSHLRGTKSNMVVPKSQLLGDSE